MPSDESRIVNSSLFPSNGYLIGVLGKNTVTINASLMHTNNLFAKIDKDTNRYPYYSGKRYIDPSAKNDVIVYTKGYVMLDNITVNKIYYSEVSNLKDGLTAYIADH